MKGKGRRVAKKRLKKPPKNKGGRPSAWLKIEPRLEELAELYGHGATMDQLAAHIGVSPAVFYKLKAQKEEFRKALEIGRQIQEDVLEGKLWELAMGKAERYGTEERRIEPGESTRKLYRELHKGTEFSFGSWGEKKPPPPAEELKKIEAAVKAIEEAGLTPVVKTKRVTYLEPQFKAIMAILKQRHG